ncbi:hypothetical protein HG536_0A06960 [Torulaspora globosa]|uniref:Uncharacterized protein n=1 Tax=Torulaspora globosa TaxID=48254 RepID=A0A7G3ZBJ5_9SACH|nr:uncharacterized protein HG536_0A06960 [Torulaspora globosa]QLL30881.1 hypothetical protein HG536_0A06960 [Torulaspora globosa]
MISLPTRRLLRDWKNLSRYNTQYSERANVLYHLKPQDSNLHVWHLVLYDPGTSVEIYGKLFIGTEDEPAIILRCLTPNEVYPTNRSVSLTHLNCILLDRGLVPFLQQVWGLFFAKDRGDSDMTDYDRSRLTFAWNRIINRDFKRFFPELVGNLAPGDYQMVKAHYQSSSGTHFGEPSAHENQVSHACTTNSLIACDGGYHAGNPLLKRTSDAGTSEMEHTEHRRKRARK